MTYVETDLTTTISELAGVDLHDLTQAQLDGIDQFHSGGAEAVDRLLPGLGLRPGMAVLDVGSGLGDPRARSPDPQVATSSASTSPRRTSRRPPR